ncbi:M2 family metallopeptidase [Telluria mixta]|uniref:M2 family metallopeptidase n=1 Tax=Telluria mixta TaxID=34071 RepID=A0ABT2BTC1_9BURK|nr:M2 family metallopeptidase [Telluria mixta]MCS0628370.1 M2 family metallopeptidase [Telluria mixta]WEM93522.1 M2 family metallopeptidase [Telluria mixta]
MRPILQRRPIGALVAAMCAGALFAAPAHSATKAANSKGKPTVAEAERFVAESEKKLDQLGLDAGRAEWVAENFITLDTETLTAQANEQYLTVSGDIALKARRYNGLKVSEASARKLMLMQQSLMLENADDRGAYARLAASMTGAYGKAKYCPPAAAGAAQPECMPLGQLEKVLATSHDPARLKEVWLGWHAQSPAYKQDYAKYVELSNKGARAMGYADTGALWRSRYDMAPDAFSAEMERLWQQVKPLYDSLHTYTRYKLRQAYGPDAVPADGPIPAHLLGNMWAQSWDNLYPILKPAGLEKGEDLTALLEERKTSAVEMTRYAEGFYTSLGMRKLPATFWERSLLTKPRDREVVCHASAWDLDGKDDVRVKMCITPTAEDFRVIHHELGHLYYDLAYSNQSPMFKNGANDGFHEAIGDTVALSITPAYLKKVGLMKTDPDPKQEIGPLLYTALQKIAFMPFAYKVDKWRWQVYGGQVKPADYDKAWWALTQQYQGVSRPAPIADGGFDAGAKFHVASDTPYARYFLAHVLQFQFHRALCKEAGDTGPLYRCSIYGNQKAGAKFQQMLEMGTSKPWPEALKAVTGSDKMDATAMLEYFAPLKTWLDEQNRQLAVEDAKLKR